MIDVGVATETLNFVGGDVIKMHLLATVTAFKQMGFGVALDADIVHDVAVTVNNAEVTLFTVDAAVDVVFMNEWQVNISINVYLGSV